MQKNYQHGLRHGHNATKVIVSPEIVQLKAFEQAYQQEVQAAHSLPTSGHYTAQMHLDYMQGRIEAIREDLTSKQGEES